MKTYLLNNAISVDQLLNTILGGAPDETLSSRAYRADMDGKILGKLLRPTIDLLFFWQAHHCHESYLSEIRRSQQPKKLFGENYES